MKKLALILLLSLLTMTETFPSDISSGMKFQSHGVPKEKRTSLILNNGRSMELPSGFSIDFDVKFNPELHNYGYIFRIIANDTISFDLVSNFNNERRTLSFIEGTNIFQPFESKTLNDHKIGEWAPVNFTIDPKSKNISIKFMNERLTLPYKYGDLVNFRFQFGQCSHPRYESYDVPPFSIRNIRLRDNTQNTLAFWPIREHAETEAYDSVAGKTAVATNPIWLMDDHIVWKKFKSLKTGQYTQTAYDRTHGRIFLADQKNLYVITPSEAQIDTLTVVAGNPYFTSTNQLIYNDYTDELWSYDFNQPVSKFDFTTNSWSQGYKVLLNPEHSQHNAVISPADSCLYIFGGYGEYHYLNEVLRYDPKRELWDTLSTSNPIPPRYLASAGFIAPDSLLVFGGYGHPSGLQDLGPSHYHDLYVINTASGQTSKLWEHADNTDPMVGSSNMVVNKNAGVFYTLYYQSNQSQSSMTLKEYDVAGGTSRFLANTLPFRFYDISSYCTLYLDENANRLYAVTLASDEETSTTDIYTLSYPPLSNDEVIIPQHGIMSTTSRILLSIASAAIIVTGVLIICRKRRLSTRKKAEVNTTDSTSNVPINTSKIKRTEISHVSSILFLGGFQVWDKDGKNITKSFTPTLKKLLVLIILHQTKNGKGISNNTICNLLWSDKSHEYAQNNRRVSIYKLKNLLSNLNGIEIINENAYWIIKFNDGSFCDYTTVVEQLRALHSSTSVRPDTLRMLLDQIALGTPLPAITQEWVDTYKADYATLVQDTLMTVVRSGIVTDYRLLTQIADVLFLFDSTDEGAIRIKCSALVKGGKIGMAKSVFDTFCHEYQNLLGVPYDKSFQDITH